MNADEKLEVQALVTSFLTAELKAYPNGVELRQFERMFPEKTDETVDWYKRYKMPNTLECLKQLEGSIKIMINRNATLISLNKNSDKLSSTRHLINLVENQKASTKRRKAPIRSQSQKALDSFAINRRASVYKYGNTNNSYQSRINHDNSFQRSQNYFVDKNPTISKPTLYKEQVARNAAPGDPRARHASSQAVPPQVRPTPPASGFGPTPTKQSAFASSSVPQQQRPPPTATNHPSRHQSSYVPAALRSESRSQQSPYPITKVDPKVEELRLRVKQRLVHLLTHKFPEIKTLFLRNLYEEEFDEPLDPELLGCKTLTQLYNSFSDIIKINYRNSMPTVTLARKEPCGNENVAPKDSNARRNTPGNAPSSSNTSASSNDQSENKENSASIGRVKYDAIDPFNVKTMLQSLEPLRQLSEPPLGNNKLEDIVKYRTLRIIFKDPEGILKLDNWEMKYQQEWNCSNKIHIRDYGFKNLLEFFKHLSTELPIRIRLKDDEWIAICTVDAMSDWLKKVVPKGHFKAVTAFDAKYEHIAFPGDKYNFLDYKNLQQQEYYSAIKMAARPADKLWLEIGSQDRFDENISFETSSSCYDDYKRKGFFEIPSESFIVPGFPCAAFDESEQRWCRAIITNRPEKIDKTSPISAFLVDYALQKEFRMSNLLCILKNHLKYPVGRLQ